MLPEINNKVSILLFLLFFCVLVYCGKTSWGSDKNDFKRKKCSYKGSFSFPSSVTSFRSFFCPDTGLHSSLIPFQENPFMGVIFHSRTKIKPTSVSFLCVVFFLFFSFHVASQFLMTFLHWCSSSVQVLSCIVIYFKCLHSPLATACQNTLTIFNLFPFRLLF